MKVLFVSSGNSENGISPIIRCQGESLIEQGIEVDFFSIKGRGLKGYLKNIPRLRHQLKHFKYDIIHAHFGLSGLLTFFGKKNEKLIVSFMGDDIVGSKDHFGRVTNFSMILVLLNKWFAKHFYDFSIVKSKEMYDILHVLNSEVIPNGVDYDRFYELDKLRARSSLMLKNIEKHVLFCSNPERVEKNFTLAKRAIALISDKNINLKCLVGINQNELINYYNAADCLLLTSFHEGSPNVIKEAMACNIPIVATDVGDVRALIGKTEGCYITSFEPDDVASKIQKALEFNKRTTGREDIRHLESGLVAQKIISIYKMVIDN